MQVIHDQEAGYLCSLKVPHGAHGRGSEFKDCRNGWQIKFIYSGYSSVFLRVNKFSLALYYLIYRFLVGCDSKDWNHIRFKQNLANQSWRWVILKSKKIK